MWKKTPYQNRKFRQNLTSVRRRSAFVIFRAIKPLLSTAGRLLTGNKLLKNDSDLSKLSLADADNDSQPFMADSSDMIDEQSVSSPDASTSKPAVRIRNTAAAAAAAASTTNGQSSQKSAKTVQQTARKSFKCCDSKKLARSNRDKMLQEKEDFQLAKMLQECIGTSDTASRYSLRSRFRNNKSSVSSSLSSSASSTQDLFQLKYHGGGSGVCTIASAKYKKSSLPFADCSSSSNSNNSTNNDITTPTTTTPRTSTALSATGAANATSSTDNSNDKFMEFSFQKLTRSRRIAMTMSGV